MNDRFRPFGSRAIVPPPIPDLRSFERNCGCPAAMRLSRELWEMRIAAFERLNPRF